MRSIMLVAVLQCVACHWGKTGSDGGEDVNVLQKSLPAAGEPSYVVQGAKASVELWVSDNALKQALYRAADASLSVRVVLDEASDPRFIIDESTGAYAVIVEQEDGSRVDFLHYDKSGAYQEGFSIVNEKAIYKLGKLKGRPTLTGQLQGQLTTADSGTGSFAVMADTNSVFADLEDVTTDMEALLSAFEGGQRAESSHLTSAGIGAKTSALLSKRLKVVGVILMALRRAGSLAPAYGAAGMMMLVGSFFANDIATYIENCFPVDDPFSRNLINIVVSSLRDPSLDGVLETIQRIVDSIKGTSADEEPGCGFRRVERYPEDTEPELPADQYPNPTESPPTVPVDVSGQAVWQDNTTFQVHGSVDPDGSVSLDGTSQDGGALEIDGNIDQSDQMTGTFTKGSTSGTAAGSAADVAACEAIQNSGGQGTFTTVHFVGAGSGESTFAYDAYSIPDAFSVSVGGMVQYATGGLVSGAGTGQITMAGERFVFVSVSAPEDGTAWEYSLSCLP